MGVKSNSFFSKKYTSNICCLTFLVTYFFFTTPPPQRLYRGYRIRRAHRQTLPERLRRNPQLKVQRDGVAWLLEGYSPLDPSRVGAAVYGVLDAFDGRPRAGVVAELRAQGRPFPSEGLLRALHHHRVLVADEAGATGITGEGPASSPQEVAEAQGRGQT